MKLEHLLQAYRTRNIEVKVKDMSNPEERAGVITFAKGISASYLIDNEEIVVAMKMFFNCLSPEALTATSQLGHTIKMLNVMQNTIMLLGGIPQKECNMILDKLGLFDNTFKEGKQIKHLQHAYSVEVVDGLLCLSINEIEELGINKRNDIPPEPKLPTKTINEGFN